MFRPDVGQLEGSTKIRSGGLVVAELLLQFAHDRVEKVMRLDQLPPLHLFDGVKTSLGTAHMRHRNRAIQGDHR